LEKEKHHFAASVYVFVHSEWRLRLPVFNHSYLFSNMNKLDLTVGWIYLYTSICVLRINWTLSLLR
jgi:hypothetical protein